MSFIMLLLILSYYAIRCGGEKACGIAASNKSDREDEIAINQYLEYKEKYMIPDETKGEFEKRYFENDPEIKDNPKVKEAEEVFDRYFTDDVKNELFKIGATPEGSWKIGKGVSYYERVKRWFLLNWLFAYDGKVFDPCFYWTSDTSSPMIGFEYEDKQKYRLYSYRLLLALQNHYHEHGIDIRFIINVPNWVKTGRHTVAIHQKDSSWRHRYLDQEDLTSVDTVVNKESVYIDCLEVYRTRKRLIEQKREIERWRKDNPTIPRT